MYSKYLTASSSDFGREINQSSLGKFFKVDKDLKINYGRVFGDLNVILEGLDEKLEKEFSDMLKKAKYKNQGKEYIDLFGENIECNNISIEITEMQIKNFLTNALNINNIDFNKSFFLNVFISKENEIVSLRANLPEVSLREDLYDVNYDKIEVKLKKTGHEIKCGFHFYEKEKNVLEAEIFGKGSFSKEDRTVSMNLDQVKVILDHTVYEGTVRLTACTIPAAELTYPKNKGTRIKNMNSSNQKLFIKEIRANLVPLIFRMSDRFGDDPYEIMSALGIYLEEDQKNQQEDIQEGTESADESDVQAELPAVPDLPNDSKDMDEMIKGIEAMTDEEVKAVYGEAYTKQQMLDAIEKYKRFQ